ncbi:cobyrinate a,c-diamide synthase [Corynebacterium pacaense]|uniref:cobyrinate a,c-diamide synthase n=1 Tax=Corynebacterium pacaense TaxID=1816684 RepID=UPI0009BA27C2|nr:cobyrinate a,c-diamide synthase [Corynebacterium pacaense]
MVAGLVIAAPASGTGKTTVATGLMRALSRSRAVAPFKVGPDFIDPGYHGMACGRAGRNLDSVMCGPELIGGLYAHGAKGADIAVVEGVMGLFDGRITPGTGAVAPAAGSTAEIAALLGLPVVLVVDVRGMSQSVGALVRGFATVDSGVAVAGVILNKVGTDRHEAVCRQAVEDQGIPVLGAIPRVDDVEVPSRHLGLITAEEHGHAAESAIDAMAALIRRHVDIDAVVRLAAEPAPSTEWDAAAGVEKRENVVVAMASGRAFNFAYPEHIELLEAAGARVRRFDPLTQDLPECDGLVIPGGFPEEHVEVLAGRGRLRAQVRSHVEAGKPVHAECAGLLWLVETLDAHPMLGVIGTHAAMGRRLTLGYREAVALGDSVLFAAGERLVGHEFHHTALTSGRAPGWDSAWAWRAWSGETVREGFIRGNVHASYLHVHPAAVPGAISRFVGACAQVPQKVM